MVIVQKKEDREKLHNKPFSVRHKLAGNKLFLMPRLAELACSLSADKVEYSSGNAKINQSPADVDMLTMTQEEVILGIEHNSAWMVLKRVESDPDFLKLIQKFIDDLAVECGIERDQFCDLQGFVFISSSNAITPFHLDAEENVLLQITGEKFFHVFDNTDRLLVSEIDMEISPSNHRNLYYEESFEKRAEVFTLLAGDGLHVPYMTPHWVETADTYCISIAMTWKTPEVLRANKIRLMNGTLRRYGLAQLQPGASPLQDSIKVFVHDLIRAIIEPLRKSESIRLVLRRIIYGRKANYYYRETDKNT